MISRAIKWIFRNHLQKSDQGVTAHAMSHLLNCLFASCGVPTPNHDSHPGDQNSNSKKKNKKGKKGKSGGGSRDAAHASAETNPAAIGWQRMTNEWREVTPR